MKQYNRIMLGAGGSFLKDCLEGNYIGANFISDTDLTDSPWEDETKWKQQMQEAYLNLHPEKSSQTARNSIGFLWTICHGLKEGDIVLASDGQGGYHVAEITGDYYYEKSDSLSHRRNVKWLNIIIPRKAMSQKLQNSTGSIGTCCNITKYAEEIETLIEQFKNVPSSIPASNIPTPEPYKERSLHRLLANHLLGKNILSKTIFHETSNRSDQKQKWVHPDMVGVMFNEFQDPVTKTLLKTTETKEYLNLCSYELKRTIENDHQLKEYFFQALSNSSWANFGYLVAFEINDDLMEEMERLNRSFGIGVIRLSAYSDDTTVLFPARKNELDYYMVDKLCRINEEFNTFIQKVTNVINADDKMQPAVRKDLESFCDSGFSSNEELMNYCTSHHIPC